VRRARGSAPHAAAQRRRLGQIAVRPPSRTISPPIQIHITSGEEISVKLAGGGKFT